MIVVMSPEASESQIKEISERLEKQGFKIHLSEGEQRTLLGVIGQPRENLAETLEAIPVVEKVVPISRPYKMASREFKPEDTVVDLGGGVQVGGEKLVIMAGPCAVEGEEQMMEVAHEIKKSGAHAIRGGAFKPRTSPYSFQGMEIEGLKILEKVNRETGLPTVTEVVDPHTVHEAASYSDVLQVGTRNMQNFYLLKELGNVSRPVLLKRGMSATIEEWLMAAEYIMSGGNENVILCERGIRTFEKATRNTLDLSAVAVAKQQSHLPVIVDPSHGTGHWHLVPAMSKAAVAAGADGLLIEVHPRPEEAVSDGPQSLNPEKFNTLMKDLKEVAACVGRKM